MMKKWQNHGMRHENKKIFREMFKNGGVFDQFAGDDGAMNFDEAKAMNAAMRKGISDQFGEEVPEYKKGQFKNIYKAYNGLSDGEGFTKADAKRADHIMKRLRDDISEETLKEFRPIFRAEAKKYENMPRGAPMKKFWNKYMKNGARKDIKQMNNMMFAKGGMWDQFAGKDGSMQLEEGKKMTAAVHKMVA
jgi:hypothetical protein